MSSFLCDKSNRILHSPELLPCVLVITRRAHREIFLIRNERGLHLPKTQIPKGERPAPHLVRQARLQWHIDGICLFRARARDRQLRHYVLEAVCAEEADSGGGEWVAADVAGGKLSIDEEVDALHAALSDARAYSVGGSERPFANFGWLEELRNWIRGELSSWGWQLQPGWEQYAMGPEFCLVRFETTGPALWFKAVGGRHLREFSIATTLAPLRSRSLPRMIASHPSWHGWLMLEAGGSDLGQVSGIAPWERAAQSLAALQIESIDLSGSLLAAGSTDLRLTYLSHSIEPWLVTINDLMTAQTVATPRALTAGELQALAESLDLACDRLSVLEVADTLNHGDLNPGNVLVHSTGAVFLDWAESSVGPPFLTFEYLLALLRRLRPGELREYELVEESYLTLWREVYPRALLEEARRWTPLLAMFAFCLNCPGWRDGREGVTTATGKMLRSMARSMYFEMLRLHGN